MPSLKFIAWTAAVSLGTVLAFERFRQKQGR